ncbi:MAG: hypothetical protein ACI9YO_000369 [Gammaproteobacteria bacterium]|jgi:hypothetical protein
MLIAIESSASRQYLDSMDSQSEMLDSLMSQLNCEQNKSIIDYASFLVDQSKILVVDAIPKLIDRPIQETVAEAIDRLKRSYFMLDADDLLNDVAALMGKHILQRLEAPVVIDELELCFQSYYRKTIDND